MIKRFLYILVFFVSVVFLSGCSTNPATGEKQFTGFMSPAQEFQIGAEEHKKVVEEYGLYDDPKLQSYVSEVGRKVTANTERKDVQYKVYLLDSSVVNAFALPGGYIYITRGLMALANSEAEMAAVMAHETGHVTARHSAERYSRNVATTIGTSILSAAIDSYGVSQALGLGSNLYMTSYSRSQESQADTLGIRYLGRAGYDMYAMPDFLSCLEADSALENKMDGTPPNSADSFFASHPDTVKRVEDTKSQISDLYKAGQYRGVVGHNEYLQMLDGLVYGDNVAQGYIRGRSFVHPKLGFMFSVPEGYKLYNTPSQVVAKDKDDGNSMIIFDIESNKEHNSPMRYLKDVWMSGQIVSDAEEITVNGMRAATAWIYGSVNNRNVKLQLMAIAWKDNQIVRFQVVLPAKPKKSRMDALKSATYSFKEMTQADKGKYRPYRIRIVTAKEGDSVASLANTMAVKDYRQDRFRVLNGLKAGQQLRVGDLYKVVEY